ncbi:hypothetical protein D3C71_1295100 [compost metagenome]
MATALLSNRFRSVLPTPIMPLMSSSAVVAVCTATFLSFKSSALLMSLPSFTMIMFVDSK